MTPEEFITYITGTVESLDDNQTFTGAEVKQLFSNIKDTIVDNINQLGYYLSAEAIDGEEFEIGSTKIAKYNIDNVVVFKINETTAEAYSADFDEITNFCKKTGLNGIILSPEFSVLKLKINDNFTPVFEYDDAYLKEFITSDIYDAYDVIDIDDD